MHLHRQPKRGLALLFAILTLAIIGPAQGAVPPTTMDYQGSLADASGVPVDGSVAMTFTLYTDPDGTNAIWSEDHTLVAVTKGLFSVTLGTTAPLDSTVFGNTVQLYLGVRVAADSAALGSLTALDDMTPRQPIHSAAYAQKADDANKVGGISGTTISQTNTDLANHVADMNNPHGVTAAQISALDQAALDAHTSDPSAHHAKTVLFSELLGQAGEGQIPDTITRDTELAAGLAGKADATHNHDTRYYTQAEVDNMIIPLVTRIAALESRMADRDALLAGVSRNGDDIVISGANLQIVSGAGTTDGHPVDDPAGPPSVNGLGNLIIGYNEQPDVIDPPLRNGSHNLIIGPGHEYQSYGGIVAGMQNTVLGAYSSVTGGSLNIAFGDYSSVSGGSENIAGDAFGVNPNAHHGSVTGGLGNYARGDYASVTGGEAGEAFGYAASVTAGLNNLANGEYSTISGGEANRSSLKASSVSGGHKNEASYPYASVSGGQENWANAWYASVTGGYGNHADSESSVVSGGRDNRAGGDFSTISGGYGIRLDGAYDWAAGSLLEADGPPPPVANTGGSYTGNVGIDITFDASGSTFQSPATRIASYAWDFGDSKGQVTTTSATRLYSYAAAGTYTVTLTVTDDLGTVSAPATTTVTVSP